MSQFKKISLAIILSTSIMLYGCHNAPSLPQQTSQQTSQGNSVTSQTQSQQNLSTNTQVTSSDCQFPENLQLPQLVGNWKNYEDKQFCFHLKYPENFSIPQNSSDTIALFSLEYPAFYSQNTNLRSATITVVVKKDDAQCLTSAYDGKKLENTLENNGIIFYKDSWKEGAAGSTGENEGYYTEQNNLCYKMILSTFSVNLANYQKSDGTYPPNAPKEFDREGIEQIFTNIFNTFQVGKIPNAVTTSGLFDATQWQVITKKSADLELDGKKEDLYLLKSIKPIGKDGLGEEDEYGIKLVVVQNNQKLYEFTPSETKKNNDDVWPLGYYPSQTKDLEKVFFVDVPNPTLEKNADQGMRMPRIVLKTEINGASDSENCYNIFYYNVKSKSFALANEGDFCASVNTGILLQQVIPQSSGLQILKAIPTSGKISGNVGPQPFSITVYEWTGKSYEQAKKFPNTKAKQYETGQEAVEGELANIENFYKGKKL